MSVSSAPVAKPVVPTGRVAPRALLALSTAEGKRLLRHPVLLAGAALGALLSISPWLGGEPAEDWQLQNYRMFLVYWAPLYLGAFVAANTAALRERQSTTAEMFRSAPTRYSERTLALLVAGLAPMMLAAALAAIHLGVIAHAGGITVGAETVTPTVLEMALVPATTAVAFAAGVALARTVRSRTFGAVLGAVITQVFVGMYWVFGWFPAYFLAPYATSLRPMDLGENISASNLAQWEVLRSPALHDSHWYAIVRDPGIVGWHVSYLIGVALLLAAYAVRRGGRDRRVRWLLVSGVVLTVGGLALQMAAFGGPFTWGDSIRGL